MTYIAKDGARIWQPSIFAYVMVWLLSTVTGIQPISAQQLRTINGSITGADGPISGATVTVLPVGQQFSSDRAGNFSITLPNTGNITLQISSIGYLSKLLKVGQDNQLQILLIKSSQSLKEVVAKGLSRERREIREVVENVVPVAILTSKDLENRAGNLNEILSRQAGIQVRQSGGTGSSARVSVRGLEGKRVQVFIEGNPLNTPDGSLGINDIPLQIIERIEIYKGAVPAWLGGDGLGSAVNVVIRHRDVSYIDATASLQSYNTQNQGLILKKSYDKSGIEVGIGAFRVSSDNDYLMELPDQPGKTVRRDHDRFHSLLAGASVKFHHLWFDELELEGAYINTEKQYQGIQRNIQSVNAKGQSGVAVINFHKNGLLDGKLSFRNNLIFTRFLSKFIDTSSYSYDWEGNKSPSLYGKGELGIGPNLTTTTQREIRDRLNINYNWTPTFSLNLNNNLRTGDMDVSDDLANSYAGRNLFGYPGSLIANITGLTLEKKWFGDKLLVSAGLKNFYSRVKGYNTNIYVTGQPEQVDNLSNELGYTLGMRYKFSNDFLLKFSHERGIRFPVNEELFGDGALITPAIYLKPEIAYNNNLGFVFDQTDASDRRLQIDANLFYMQVDQLIQLAGNGLSLGYVNYAKAKILGGDVDFKYDLTKQIYGAFNLTYQRVEDDNPIQPGTQGVENPTYGLALPNIPQFFANLNLEYHRNGLIGNNRSKTRLMYDGSFVRKFNYGFAMSIYDQYVIPSYFTHTLAIEQSFADSRYTFTLEGNNLFDAKVISNYNQPLPGRTFRLKLRYLLLANKKK